MAAVERAKREGVQLIVTADIGVRDHVPVAAAAAAGVDVIVCDHHLPDGESVPEAALAVLCPPQQGCAYPNKALAGQTAEFSVQVGEVAEVLGDEGADAGGAVEDDGVVALLVFDFALVVFGGFLRGGAFGEFLGFFEFGEGFGGVPASEEGVVVSGFEG
jgi:hypothetical protein